MEGPMTQRYRMTSHDDPTWCGVKDVFRDGEPVVAWFLRDKAARWVRLMNEEDDREGLLPQVP
jgi:hypothetical protein